MVREFLEKCSVTFHVDGICLHGSNRKVQILEFQQKVRLLVPLRTKVILTVALKTPIVLRRFFNWRVNISSEFIQLRNCTSKLLTANRKTTG